MKSQLSRHVMVGIAEIAEASGVSPKRVRLWISMGAPIWHDKTSNRWLAHVNELWEWRKTHDLEKAVNRS